MSLFLPSSSSSSFSFSSRPTASRRQVLGWLAALAGTAGSLPGMAATGSSSPSSLPQSADLLYQVSWGPLTLDAEQHWRLDGKRYTLSTELKLPLAFKNRRYVSHGTVGEAGLVPELYEDLEVGDPKPRNVAQFDRAAGLLHYGRLDKLKTAALEPGMQDMNVLSFQLAFLGLQAVGKPMPVTNGKSVVQHRFSQAVATPVQVNGKSVETVRLQSTAVDGDIEVWLAPSLGNLPVTVVRGQDGKSLRFVASSISFKP
ncbi:DUF3108 domain-containing protein [Ideonella azotifigens]|uniref:DUF3108 domain-containing protein n=1 Tax=Ideonella azotifigens TaxID=513160 RepID=A0ABN1JPR8_9BURK|nr:DUF3108 domain-containing protein [Ideonella azotifigens]MCD2340097.1 DUF3108 domain-containing protein [Ideonella azotifigens]